MAKRLNVMLSIDDDIFESVIEPARYNRRLNKLLCGLLEAYYKDTYVQNLVDGVVVGIENDALADLAEKLKTLRRGIEDQSMYISEATTTLREGSEDFNSGTTPIVAESTKDVKEGNNCDWGSRFDKLESLLGGILEAVKNGKSIDSDEEIDIKDDVEDDFIALPSPDSLEEDVEEDATDILNAFSLSEGVEF